jgi:hypothetical protein
MSVVLKGPRVSAERLAQARSLEWGDRECVGMSGPIGTADIVLGDKAVLPGVLRVSRWWDV